MKTHTARAFGATAATENLKELSIQRREVTANDAEIYILLANPGRDIKREKDLLKLIEKQKLEKIIINNLNHEVEESEYPFYFLDPKFEKHPGAKWWLKAFKNLIKKDESRRKILSNNVFGIELYGYHSKNCEKRLVNNKKNTLESPLYSYELIKKAIDDGKLIILSRAVKDWYKKVSELQEYPNCHLLASNRGIQFTRNTISPSAFMKIEKIFEK